MNCMVISEMFSERTERSSDAMAALRYLSKLTDFSHCHRQRPIKNGVNDKSVVKVFTLDRDLDRLCTESTEPILSVSVLVTVNRQLRVIQTVRLQRQPLAARNWFITARKRSLGQGYIFTPVCHSVHRGGSSSVHAGIPHTPPEQATPWDQAPPRNQAPPGSRACWEIQSTSGRYASYWNAILFVQCNYRFSRRKLTFTEITTASYKWAQILFIKKHWGKEWNSLVSMTLFSMSYYEVNRMPTYILGTEIKTKTERNTDKLGTESVLVPVQYEHHTILYKQFLSVSVPVLVSSSVNTPLPWLSNVFYASMQFKLTFQSRFHRSCCFL